MAYFASFFVSFFAKLFGRFLFSKLAWYAVFFEFLVPLLTNTSIKLLGSVGGGFAVYALGDAAFDYLFDVLTTNMSSLPVAAAQIIKLMGVDTAINIYVSFLFALATIKGMSRLGQIRRQVWSKPSSLGEKTGTMEF